MKRTIKIGFVMLVASASWLIAQDLNQPALDTADKAAQDAEKKVDEAEKAAEGKVEVPAASERAAEKPAGTQPATADNQVGNIYNDGKTTYATSQAKFELTATDNISNLDFIEYKINESYQFSVYGHPFSLEKEGPHKITYRSVDRVGNREEDNIFNVIIDNTGPYMNFALNKAPIVIDGKRYLAPGTKLEIRATDNFSGVKSVEYSTNGSDWQPYKDGIVLDKPGAAQLKYRAIDNLGNKSENLSGFSTTTPGQGASPEDLAVINSLYVENTAPIVMITPAKRWINVDGKKYAMRDNTYLVEAQDAESGVANIFVKVDNGAEWQIYSGKLAFQTEGPHSIEAKAVDKVGNESQPVKVEFIVDDNPPKSTIRPVGTTAEKAAEPAAAPAPAEKPAEPAAPAPAQ
ncbi:MAG: OmpL47-type beta-barrel domain-containing protein [Spirochaetota bacterium]